MLYIYGKEAKVHTVQSPHYITAIDTIRKRFNLTF